MAIHHKGKSNILKVVNLLIQTAWLPVRMFSKKPDPSTLHPKKILMLRLDHIGDVVMTSPAFALLRKRFPSATLILLTDASGYELYKTDTHIDEIKVFNWPWSQQQTNNRFTLQKVKELFALIKTLRIENIDVCIDFRGDLRFVILFGLLAGIRVRIGNNRTGKTSLLQYQSVYAESKHEVERSLDVVSFFAKPPASIRPHITLRNYESDTVKQLLSGITKHPFPQKLAVIAPYSSQNIKSWPPDHFRKVINYFTQNDFTVIVAGAPADAPDAADLIHGLKGEVYNLAGKTSIREAAALTALSSVVVGVDTGILHIAACFDVPVIAIFGATRPQEFRPYSPFTQVIESGTCTCNRFLHLKCDVQQGAYSACLKAVTPEVVINAITKVIKTEQPDLKPVGV